MEVSKIYHVKCVSFTKMIHKSNSIIVTTHFLYYLLNIGLPFCMFAIWVTFGGRRGANLSTIYFCLGIFFLLLTVRGENNNEKSVLCIMQNRNIWIMVDFVPHPWPILLAKIRLCQFPDQEMFPVFDIFAEIEFLK